jgi:hypothetical protein
VRGRGGPPGTPRARRHDRQWFARRKPTPTAPSRGSRWAPAHERGILRDVAGPVGTCRGRASTATGRPPSPILSARRLPIRPRNRGPPRHCPLDVQQVEAVRLTSRGPPGAPAPRNEIDVPLRMPALQRRLFAGFAQALRSVQPHRLQKPISTLPASWRQRQARGAKGRQTSVRIRIGVLTTFTPLAPRTPAGAVRGAAEPTGAGAEPIEARFSTEPT